MSSSGPSAETSLESIPADLVEAGAYLTVADGSYYGLVVLAMGHPYWLVPAGDGFRLLVEPQHVDAVRVQLARYDRESIGWPPRPIADYLTTRKGDLLTPMLWSLIVLTTYGAQQSHPAWTEAGAVDATAIFARGEWWRAATALFLHSNLDHVVSNAFSGLLIFAAVLSTIGLARGWLLLGVASIAANLAIAAFHYPDGYRSLGASTAIFTGVGLLTGRALRVVARSGHPHRKRSLFVPFAAGSTVLALYGGGVANVPVDVGAHVAGFVVGAIVGFFWGRSSRGNEAVAR